MKMTKNSILGLSLCAIMLFSQCSKTENDLSENHHLESISIEPGSDPVDPIPSFLTDDEVASTIINEMGGQEVSTPIGFVADPNMTGYLTVRFFTVPGGHLHEVYVWEDPNDSGYRTVKDGNVCIEFWHSGGPGGMHSGCDSEGTDCIRSAVEGKTIVVCCD